MKKIIYVGIIVFALGTIINQNANDKMINLSLENINTLAMAGGEGCTTTPGSNTGACKQNVSGSGWNCVSAGFWDSKDCSGD